MFNSETLMNAPVARWLKSLGLQVRSEFITPWGVCDLVGVRFRSDKVRQRVNLGQYQAVTSVTRAALLLAIPDEGSAEATSARALIRKFAFIMPSDVIHKQVERLIADKFVVQTSEGHFQKRNGWAPMHKRLVAVELKLNRIEEVLSQARNNLLFAEESYVALPSDVAQRVGARKARWSEFFESGVGLLSVSPRSCRLVIQSRPPSNTADELLQFCSVEKFWRNRPKRS